MKKLDLERNILMIPGPVSVHPRVLRELSKPIMAHREKDFEEIVAKARNMLKEIFKTKNDVIILAGSSTSGMDAALGNISYKGSKMIIPTFGKFSERFRDIALSYGADVIEIKKEYGESVILEDIKEKFTDDIDAIALVHNETSTGVKTPIGEIGNFLKDKKALFVVDCVSSLSGDNIEVDNYNIDLCVSGSQKALSLPPGLAFVSISDKAWNVIEKNDRKAYYLDLKRYKDALKKSEGNMPFTHPISMIYALVEALKMIIEEGIDKRINRHKIMAEAVRAAIEAMNLEFFVKDKITMSETVTSVKIPKSIEDKDIRGPMKNEYGITLAGGQANLAGKIFRIAHMGITSERDILAAIASLELVLHKAGHNFNIGEGTKAAIEIFSKN